MIHARVSYDEARMALSVTVLRDDPRAVWRPPDPGELRVGAWEPVGPAEMVEPSLVFDYEVGEALVEAFARYTALTRGYTPVEARADYLAERARVDNLLEVVSSIAGAAVERALSPRPAQP